jgi:hypothetical protein
VKYLLPCPCGQSVPVARSQAGMRIVCPQCNANLDIPTIRGMANLVSLAPEELKSSTSSSASRLAGNSAGKPSDYSTASPPTPGEPQGGTVRRALTAAFLIVFVVAGLTTARWAIIRYFNPTPFTVEDEINYGANNLANFTPSDAWDAWQFYQSTGLTEKRPETYYRIKRAMELQDENMRAGGVLTAIALGCLITILFIPKRRQPF